LGRLPGALFLLRCDKHLAGEETVLKRKCWPAPEVIANVNRDELGDLGLTDREIDDIVAFMKPLTDGWQAATSTR
jgi:cytochrome c peroxidase